MAVAVAYRPGRVSLLIFRVAMAVLVMTGAFGVFLHYDENVTFERELNPNATGLDLIWMTLRGATPILAPGALVQLGLLGLILIHDHPALKRAGTEERDR
jgi:hypothetical protein